MPPITSSRPGARLTRSDSPGVKSADNSARRRRSSVGTGSVERRSGRDRPGGGAGCGAGGLKGDFLPFQYRAVEEACAGARVKGSGEDVALAGVDRRVGELERVRPARAVPPGALLVERH